jgi:hypothetical protein
MKVESKVTAIAGAAASGRTDDQGVTTQGLRSLPTSMGNIWAMTSAATR